MSTLYVNGSLASIGELTWLACNRSDFQKMDIKYEKEGCLNDGGRGHDQES
jgi:hypothetical protein